VPKWLKVLLIVSGAAVIFIVGIGVAATMWLSANKESFKRQGEALLAEARTFGAVHDQNECLDESMKRVDGCGAVSFVCQAEAGIFLQHCLESSKPTEGFCDGVPDKNAVMDTAMYRIAKCESLGGRKGDGPCGRVLASVERYCQARATNAAP
jgi:hypothetical protein